MPGKSDSGGMGCGGGGRGQGPPYISVKMQCTCALHIPKLYSSFEIQ